MLIKILAFLIGHLMGTVLGTIVASHLITKQNIKRQNQAVAEYCEHKSQIETNPIKQKYYKEIGAIINEK